MARRPKKKNGNGLLPAAVVREQEAKPLVSIPVPAPEPPENSKVPPVPLAEPTPEKSPVQETNSPAPLKAAQASENLDKGAEEVPATKKASALSLASIQRKKNWEAKKQQQANSPEDLPEEEYSTEAFTEHWNAYLKLLQDDGRKILASSLASDTPRITPTHGIQLSLANDTMKKEIEREQGPLLAYLREKLQNYSLHLKLDVSATVAEKYAFTPRRNTKNCGKRIRRLTSFEKNLTWTFSLREDL